MPGLINRNFCPSISKANAHSFNSGGNRSGMFKLSYRAIKVNIKVGKSESRKSPKVRKRKFEHPVGKVVVNKGKYIALTVLLPTFSGFRDVRTKQTFLN